MRKGLVRLIPMRDVAAKTVLRHLFKNIKLDGMEAVYTDDYPAYNFLDSLAHHETINYSSGECAKGKIHINTVEAEFSVFRPWNATLRGYSKENPPIHRPLQLSKEQLPHGQSKANPNNAHTINQRLIPTKPPTHTG